MGEVNKLLKIDAFVVVPINCIEQAQYFCIFDLKEALLQQDFDLMEVQRSISIAVCSSKLQSLLS